MEDGTANGRPHFGKLPVSIRPHLREMNLREMRVLLVLTTYVDGRTGQAPVGMDTLAEVTGMAHRTIRRAITGLRELGVLGVDHGGGKPGNANRYTLMPPETKPATLCGRITESKTGHEKPQNRPRTCEHHHKKHLDKKTTTSGSRERTNSEAEPNPAAAVVDVSKVEQRDCGAETSSRVGVACPPAREEAPVEQPCATDSQRIAANLEALHRLRVKEPALTKIAHREGMDVAWIEARNKERLEQGKGTGWLVKALSDWDKPEAKKAQIDHASINLPSKKEQAETDAEFLEKQQRFLAWWDSLSDSERAAIAAKMTVGLEWYDDPREKQAAIRVRVFNRWAWNNETWTVTADPRSWRKVG